MTKITKLQRIALIIIDAANRAIPAGAIVCRSPFKGIYNISEMSRDILRPLVDSGLLALIERRSNTYYNVTDGGLDALVSWVEPVENKTPGYLINKMTGHYSPSADAWPVASQRGDHRHIASVGFPT